MPCPTTCLQAGRLSARLSHVSGLMGVFLRSFSRASLYRSLGRTVFFDLRHKAGPWGYGLCPFSSHGRATWFSLAMTVVALATLLLISESMNNELEMVDRR
ncbi:hypothetical protein RRG08_030976 [Elysia crispata]|uniref:Uncharacterized protein n=1 Tax=Elysia crispata TaxID=231223 RepID=A0AAE1DLX0_9GAST|nr:hypothetical protein RRG08_030976 [Elysia crispata]